MVSGEYLVPPEAPNQCCFFCGGLFNGGSVEDGWALSGMVVADWSSRNLPVGLHHLRWHHRRRRHMAPSLPSTQGCSPPKGMVGLAWADLISLPNTGEPVHRPWSSPTVPLRHPGSGTLDLTVGGNPSDGDIWVPGEPGSNSPCHVVCSFSGGAQKRPISFRPAPGSCLLLGLPPARHIECPSPPCYPHFIFLCWGFQGGIAFAIFPWFAGQLLKEAVDLWSQLWWGP